VRGYLVLLLLAGAGGCARDDGHWPSLKPRPAELRGLQTMRDGDPVRATGASPPPTANVGAIASRLTDAEGEFERLRRGLSVEKAAMTSTLAAAQGSTRNSDAWAAAQLQLTRVEAVAGQLDDLQPSVEQLSRDAQAADGEKLARARALAAGLDMDRATLSRLTQAARDALAR